MNFKRNLLSIIALIGSTFAVSACFLQNNFKEYVPIEETPDATEDEYGTGYVKPHTYSDYYAYDNDGTTKSIGSAYNVTSEYSKKKVLKPTGERKIIVIPVDFVDFTAYTLNVKTDEYVTNLKNAFFGSSSANKYVSVAEYYNRSSYGKLRITGKVLDQFYRFNTSVEEINKGKEDKLVRDNLSNIYNWYESTYLVSSSELKQSDTAIYLVYTLPTELGTENPTFFWNYTFPDLRLCWSSYSTMNTVSGSPDAHTFIHEVGHLFGLQDYYPTKQADQKPIEPTARIDMMDCSVGDHTAFSKMYLNWLKPTWIKDSCEISMKPLINSGDILLINDSWNGNVFDEYYLIEFYVPLGLNYFDSVNGNNMAKLPNLPGIKIYHVDARLAYFILKSEKASAASAYFACYCDEVIPAEYKDKFIIDNKPLISFAHDNSTPLSAPSGGSEEEEEETTSTTIKHLYELKLNHVSSGSASGCASNINLFRPGDTYEAEDLIFNKTNNTKYNISVTGMTYESARIKIEKVS